MCIKCLKRDHKTWTICTAGASDECQSGAPCVTQPQRIKRGGLDTRSYLMRACAACLSVSICWYACAFPEIAWGLLWHYISRKHMFLADRTRGSQHSCTKGTKKKLGCCRLASEVRLGSRPLMCFYLSEGEESSRGTRPLNGECVSKCGRLWKSVLVPLDNEQGESLV